MVFNEYYVCNSKGKSNCVIRSFCKFFNDDYDNVFNDLCNIANELKCESFNDIEVFETYMKRKSTFPLDYGKKLKVKDLHLDNGKYLVFCWDKKDFYHMVPIIDNTLYDKSDDCLDLYTITVYKENTLLKK